MDFIYIRGRWGERTRSNLWVASSSCAFSFLSGYCSHSMYPPQPASSSGKCFMSPERGSIASRPTFCGTSSPVLGICGVLPSLVGYGTSVSTWSVVVEDMVSVVVVSVLVLVVVSVPMRSVEGCSGPNVRSWYAGGSGEGSSLSSSGQETSLSAWSWGEGFAGSSGRDSSRRCMRRYQRSTRGLGWVGLGCDGKVAIYTCTILLYDMRREGDPSGRVRGSSHRLGHKARPDVNFKNYGRLNDA